LKRSVSIARPFVSFGVVIPLQQLARFGDARQMLTSHDYNSSGARDENPRLVDSSDIGSSS
jgi:hypothetical protein